MAATDPTVKAADQGIADTLFKGTTLQSMLNEAWTFSVMGQIAFFAGIGLLLAGLVVLVALGFEVVEAVRGKESVKAIVVTASANGKVTPTREPAIVN